MEKIKKIFNQKTRNILSIIIIILGVAFLINYIFYTPSYINAYIATNIYKEPANKYFDDDNFYKCVVNAYNKENSTSIPYTQSLSDGQLGSIKRVECWGYNKSDNAKVKSAKGVEKLTALTRLEVDHNQLTTLDVSNNTALTRLKVENNQLTTLDVSNNTALEWLHVYENQLTTLDVSKNTNLTDLRVSRNQLTTFNVSKNTALTWLDVEKNQLTTIDVSNNTKLKNLFVDNNQLTTLDVSKNTALHYLGVNNNQLTTLDVSKNTALYDLDIGSDDFQCSYNYGNNLTTLDVSKNTNLTYLHVNCNNLTTLDVSKNTKLKTLSVCNNQLTTLNASGATSLTKLYAYNNQLTTLDVSGATSLTELYASNNQLTTLDVSKNTALTELNVGNNQLTTFDVSKNTALTGLTASNNQLTTLNVSNNTALTGLYADNNQLTTLDVSNNTALTYLHADNNQLTTLDVSKNTALTYLHAYNNKLTTLDVSNNTALTYLHAYNNKLTTLNASGATSLTELYAYNNQLTTLDVSGATSLTELYAYNNQLTTLDVSKNTALTELDVNANKLSTIYTKLNDTFSINKGLILPDGWNKKVSNDNKKPLSFDGNNGKGFKVGNYVIPFRIYNSQGKLIFYSSGNYYNDKFTIYVYDVVSDIYGIDKDNIYIYNDDSNDVILNNIKIDDGNVDGYTKNIDNNKLIIKHNEKVIKEYNLVKLEVSSNEYFVEDKEIKYIGEFDVNKINLNYGSKEVKDNKLIIKNNDKVIREYELVKIEIKSKHYSINGDNIVYVNDFDINKIDLNYGSKEFNINKLVIKYNDKVIKEYKLYGIKTNYSVINNTIYVGGIINTEDELRECIKNCGSATDQVGCADDCEMRYNILDHITSRNLKLSIDNDKLICKYNDVIINEFVLSYKDEYEIIDDYTKENDIISRIPIDTDMNVFKTKVNTNIGYIFKDSKNNDIVTNRKLRTGDKVIFNYSSGDIDYVLSVIGDVNGDGIINGKDIIEISNDIVGNKKLDNLGSLSGDIDNNGKMDIRDIIKMGNYIKKGKF